MPVWDVKLATVLVKNGWIVTGLKTEPHDVVVLVDGPAVAPFLYGQRRIPTLKVDPERDLKELGFLRSYSMENSAKFPKIGFGRGAHMLNILNGGSAWQFANNHEGPTVHQIVDLWNGKERYVTTNHQQIMRTACDAHLLAIASHESTTYIDERGPFLRKNMKQAPLDPEACYYEETNSLCFQPSDLTHGPTADFFFELCADWIKPKHLAE